MYAFREQGWPQENQITPSRLQAAPKSRSQLVSTQPRIVIFSTYTNIGGIPSVFQPRFAGLGARVGRPMSNRAAMTTNSVSQALTPSLPKVNLSHAAPVSACFSLATFLPLGRFLLSIERQVSKPIREVEIRTAEGITASVDAVLDSGSFYSVRRESYPSGVNVLKLKHRKMFGTARKGGKLPVTAPVAT